MPEPESHGQHFTITNLETGAKFVAQFTDGPAIVTEGYAGWQVVPRPREIGVVEWQGRNPMAIEIPFMIDYFTAIESASDRCESKVTVLETMCGIGTHNQPPILRVDGEGAIPHDYTINKQLVWVIEQLTWSKEIELRDRVTGRRVRAGGTIQIRQFITAKDILRTIGPKSRARIPRVHTVVRGENLRKIANIYYGEPNKWKIIADANNLRDPRNLKINAKLKIPRIG
jgi:hypothetical protein